MRIAGSGRGRRRSSKLASLGIFALLVGVLAACDTTPVVLSGTVSAAPSGHGVGGVTVAVYADDAETLVDQTTTNLLGAYTLHTSSVADGAYRVRIGERWWPDAASWADAATVELTESSPTTIDLALDEIGSLSGRIVDDGGDPLADIVVAAVRVTDGQTVAVDPTDAAGDFQVPVVAPGTHRIVLADLGTTWPQMSVGGTTPTPFDVTGGDVAVGTIDITTGHPYTPGKVITRVSIASDGTQATNISQEPSISADGRYVAFTSTAVELVTGDTNGRHDIFVHDRSTGVTTRVSVASDGTQANNGSLNPQISGDGRFVAFRSGATNLVAGDTNRAEDVFVHDRSTGVTSRVSVASDGAQGGSHSDLPSISGDGRYVAFRSISTNLVPGDTNMSGDVFVHDRTTGLTSRVSITSDGTQANGGGWLPSISADGNRVAFASRSTNLVLGDTNMKEDAFVHDRTTGLTWRASVSTDGTQGDDHSASPVAPSISGDGRFVAFSSWATNLVAGDTNLYADVFVHDLATGVTSRVSVASDGSEANYYSDRSAAISADGRYVAFYTGARSLIGSDARWDDVVVHDRSTGVTTGASFTPDGRPPNNAAYELTSPSISANGRYLAFASKASNLVAGDTNGRQDIFVLRRAAD